MCHSKNEPIFVTKNGYGDLVVMSMETYDSMISIRDTDNAIKTSKSEIENAGNLLDAKMALKGT